MGAEGEEEGVLGGDGVVWGCSFLVGCCGVLFEDGGA